MSLSTLGFARRDPDWLLDNLVLDDPETIIEEVSLFSDSGGGTIVDVTPEGMGRNSRGLVAAAEATNVHVIAGTGFYREPAHPAFVATTSEAELAKHLVTELMDGISGSSVRAGIIGEIGLGTHLYGKNSYRSNGDSTDSGITTQELKVLRAAGYASLATGAPIMLHVWNFGPNNIAIRAIETLTHLGVMVDRIVVAHADVRVDIEYCREVLASGCYLEFDMFGQENAIDSALTEFPRDTERVRLLKQLIDAGYGSRLLVSHDVNTKAQLTAFGGWGLAHLSVNIEPRMAEAGIDSTAIFELRQANPSRLLAWA